MIFIREIVEDCIRAHKVHPRNSPPFTKSQVAVLYHVERMLLTNQPLNFQLVCVVKSMYEKLADNSLKALRKIAL